MNQLIRNNFNSSICFIRAVPSRPSTEKKLTGLFTSICFYLEICLTKISGEIQMGFFDIVCHFYLLGYFYVEVER